MDGKETDLLGNHFLFLGTPPMVDLLVPPPEDTGPGKLTVGKVYGGMLILENWKLSRFGQGFNTNKGLPVSLVSYLFSPLFSICSHEWKCMRLPTGREEWSSHLPHCIPG